MQNEDYKNARFNSYINKSIKLNSRKYFLKQMNKLDKEGKYIDTNESLCHFDNSEINNYAYNMDYIDVILDLAAGYKELSDNEQKVLFYLYYKELTQKQSARLLKMYIKSIGRIDKRALEKLRKYIKGEK